MLDIYHGLESFLMNNVSHELRIIKSRNTGVGIIRSNVATCGATNKAIVVNNSSMYIVFRFIFLLLCLVSQRFVEPLLI